MSPESNSQGRQVGLRPRRADAARNRAVLVQTARSLFDKHGVDVPLDQIAKRAGVGNATLYRHFPSRAELIVAVYASEVEALRQASDDLLEDPDPGQALTSWLLLFVRHIATKQDLALALPDDNERGVLFGAWHATMHDAASQLFARAREAGAVRAGITTTDMLALARGIALTGLPSTQLEALLDMARHGYQAGDEDPPSPIRRGRGV